MKANGNCVVLEDERRDIYTSLGTDIAEALLRCPDSHFAPPPGIHNIPEKSYLSLLQRPTTITNRGVFGCSPDAIADIFAGRRFISEKKAV